MLKFIGVVIVVLVLALVILRITGLNPKGPRAGLWLTGNLVTTPVTDWTFTDNFPNVEVETHPWYMIAHSVTIFCTSYNGRLYLSSYYLPPTPPYPHSRKWNEAVASDPHARIKIGDNLYDRTLVYVTDDAEKAGVMASERKKYAANKIPVNAQFNIFRVDDN